MNHVKSSKYTGKRLVSYLRKGDFSHAGEAQAIDLVMNKFKNNHQKELFQSNGWKITEQINVTENYLGWYGDLVDKLENNETPILKQFGEEAYHSAYSVYSNIYNVLLSGCHLASVTTEPGSISDVNIQKNGFSNRLYKNKV